MCVPSIMSNIEGFSAEQNANKYYSAKNKKL